jgi:hypothetical protein
MTTEEMFDPERLLRQECPGDTTIGESKSVILKVICADLAEKIKPRTLRVRFMIGTEECPDEMTVGEFRQRNGTIFIEEGTGGVKAKQPEPALV